MSTTSTTPYPDLRPDATNELPGPDDRYRRLPAAIIEHLKAAGYLADDAGDACRCVPFDAACVWRGAMLFGGDHPGRPELRHPSEPYICMVHLRIVEWAWNGKPYASLYVGSCGVCKRIHFSSQTPLERLGKLTNLNPHPAPPEWAASR